MAAPTSRPPPACATGRCSRRLGPPGPGAQLALGRRAPELAAEDVRLAARALERLSGRIDPEAVLDRIFASFCIGK